MAHGLPAAISLAAEDSEVGGTLVSALGSQTFRPYYTEDVTSVPLRGGAIKSAIGFDAGIVAGCGYGENARAALLIAVWQRWRA